MPALKNTQELPLQYQRLRQKLAHIGWIALGSLVQRVKPGQGGPRYQWSRRIGPKTVTVALSAEQFDWLKEAISNQRQVWDILMELQQLTAQHWKSSQGPLDASASAKNAWALTNGHSDATPILFSIGTLKKMARPFIRKLVFQRYIHVILYDPNKPKPSPL